MIKIRTKYSFQLLLNYDLNIYWRVTEKLNSPHRYRILIDNGYPHDGRADKDPYPHDRRADKDSYPHDSNNQCIILRLQLSFAMINVQLMLV